VIFTCRMKKNVQKNAPKPKPKQQGRPGPRRGAGRTKNRDLEFAPAAQSRIMRSGNPTYSAFNRSDASIIVKHREYFSDVNGNTAAFQLVGPGGTQESPKFQIQPAVGYVFPWLAALAQLYESYDFLALQFDYVPRCSTSTPGYVAMGVDYDAKDAPPSSKIALMSYHGASASAPWQSSSVICDSRDLHKFGRQLYCKAAQSSSSTTSYDQKTYDVGNLWVAVGQQSAVSLIGELYVTYTIRLSTPQLNIAALAKAASKVITATAGITKTVPLGTAQAQAGGLPIKPSQSYPGTKILVDPGQYLLNVFANGTGLATGAVNLTSDDTANNVSTINDIANAAGTLQEFDALLNVVKTGYFTMAAAGATTLTGLALRAARYSPSSSQIPGTALNEAEVPGED
jgi:hypothetical protein